MPSPTSSPPTTVFLAPEQVHSPFPNPIVTTPGGHREGNVDNAAIPGTGAGMVTDTPDAGYPQDQHVPIDSAPDLSVLPFLSHQPPATGPVTHDLANATQHLTT